MSDDLDVDVERLAQAIQIVTAPDRAESTAFGLDTGREWYGSPRELAERISQVIADGLREDHPDRERVGCDYGCGAMREPETVEEVRAALEHWHEHPYLNGCSHGQ